MNAHTALESAVLAQAEREAHFDALRAERAANGPSELEIAQQRIKDLEAQRDSIYADVAGWLRDLQEYFPGATGQHDVFRGIEAMEVERDKFRAAIQKTIDENGHLADGDNCTLIELKRAIGVA